MAAGGGITAGGVFGLGAGLTGVGLTVYNAVKEGFGDKNSLTSNLALGPATYAAGGGAGFLLLAEKGGFQNRAAINAIRGGGAALILGGVAGAVLGALPMLHNPHDESARNNTLVQSATAFTPTIATSPNELEGIALATGEVTTRDGSVKREQIYIDPETATRIRTDDLASAINKAHSSSQNDTDDRSFAVLETRNGALWIARLSGKLDQVDGRNYTTDTDYDPRFRPKIVKQQPSLMAVAGVESNYVFPTSLDPTSLPPNVFGSKGGESQ